MAKKSGGVCGDLRRLKYKDMEIITEKWNEILEYLRDQFHISKVAYNTWLLPIEPTEIKDGCLYINTPDIIHRRYMERRYTVMMEKAVEDVAGMMIRIVFYTK